MFTVSDIVYLFSVSDSDTSDSMSDDGAHDAAHVARIPSSPEALNISSPGRLRLFLRAKKITCKSKPQSKDAGNNIFLPTRRVSNDSTSSENNREGETLNAQSTSDNVDIRLQNLEKKLLDSAKLFENELASLKKQLLNADISAQGASDLSENPDPRGEQLHDGSDDSTTDIYEDLAQERGDRGRKNDSTDESEVASGATTESEFVVIKKQQSAEPTDGKLEVCHSSGFKPIMLLAQDNKTHLAAKPPLSTGFSTWEDIMEDTFHPDEWDIVADDGNERSSPAFSSPTFRVQETMASDVTEIDYDVLSLLEMAKEAEAKGDVQRALQLYEKVHELHHLLDTSEIETARKAVHTHS